MAGFDEVQDLSTIRAAARRAIPHRLISSWRRCQCLTFRYRGLWSRATPERLHNFETSNTIKMLISLGYLVTLPSLRYVADDNFRTFVVLVRSSGEDCRVPTARPIDEAGLSVQLDRRAIALQFLIVANSTAGSLCFGIVPHNWDVAQSTPSSEVSEAPISITA